MENLGASAAERSASVDSYSPPEIQARGSLNQLTRGGSFSGNLDGSYPVGTSSSYGGGLFS